MKKTLFAFLTPLSLMADPCCMPLENPNCYEYAVNPPLISQPCCVWGGRFDFLYWKPFAENNAFAAFKTTAPVGSSLVNYTHLEKDFPYDYQAGFRVGVDAGLPCNEWRAGLNWTHFLHDTRATASGTAPTQYVYIPQFFEDGLIKSNTTVTVTNSNVTATWNVQLESVDLVLNREFYVGHRVTLRPYSGLRALFLKQKVESFNEIVAQNTGMTVGSGTMATNVKLSSDFKGVGIVGGLFSSWDLLCDLGFYGDFSTSIFYGKSKSGLNGIVSNPGFAPLGAGETDTFNQEYNVNTVKATLDVAFGIQWRQSLCDGIFTLRAGWEEHLFFRQNTFPSILSLPVGGSDGNLNFVSYANGDLSFQGLVISASFTF